MAEFNRQALDAMDEIGSPLQRAITNRQNLERQAATLEMQRRTQVQDQEMRRRQQLEDAARAREEKLEDARQSFFERQQLMDKEDKLQRDRILFTEEQKKKARKDVEAERLADRRNAVIKAKEIINKNGVDLGFTLEDINKAGSIGLANYEQQYKQAMSEVMNNKKTRRELENNVRKITKDGDKKILFDAASDALGFEVTDINEIIDGADKPQLDSILAEYQTDKTVMDNPGAVAQFSQLMQQQFEINNQSGIYDLILNRNNASDNQQIASAMANDMKFIASLRELGASDDDVSDIKANLSSFNVQGAIERAGEYSSAIVEAYTDIGSKVAAQQNLQIQAKIMDAKEKSGRYSGVQSSINALTRQFPWLWTLSPQEYLTPRQIQQTNQRIQRYGLGQGQAGVINPNAAQGGGGNTGASGGGIPEADLSGLNNALGTGALNPTPESSTPAVRGVAGLLMQKPQDGSQSPLELAEELMDETYFTGRLARGGIAEMIGLGDNSPLGRVQQAIEYLKDRQRKVSDSLGAMGAARDSQGNISLSDTKTIDNVYEAGGGFTTYKKTSEDILEDQKQAPLLFDELDDISAKLKKLREAAARAAGATAPTQSASPAPQAQPAPPFIDTNPNPPQGLPQGETFGQPIPNMPSTSPEAKAYNEAIRKGVDSGALKIVSPEDAAKRFEKYKKIINP